MCPDFMDSSNHPVSAHTTKDYQDYPAVQLHCFQHLWKWRRCTPWTVMATCHCIKAHLWLTRKLADFKRKKCVNTQKVLINIPVQKIYTASWLLQDWIFFKKNTNITLKQTVQNIVTTKINLGCFFILLLCTKLSKSLFHFLCMLKWKYTILLLLSRCSLKPFSCEGKMLVRHYIMSE